MKESAWKTKARRVNKLRQILTHERTQAYERVRSLRAEQRDDADSSSGDELDNARVLAEVETHAALIERAEYRLKAIDGALNRLERNLYGVCEECGKDIPVQRLEALPFAAYCVKCQRRRNSALEPGRGSIDEASRKLWTAPPEMDESLETQDSVVEPEERLFVHHGGPFGTEVGEFEQLPPVATARRRGRVKRGNGEH